MKTMTIGIDPGLSGGVAVLIDGEFKQVHAMPVEIKANGRRQVDAFGMLDLARRVHQDHARSQTQIVIEAVSAMPHQGVSGMFSLGDSFGCARMFAAFFSGARVDIVQPVAWKRAAKLLKKPKEFSLALARRRFPAARSLLELKKFEGLAEALLLAEYGYGLLPTAKT